MFRLQSYSFSAHKESNADWNCSIKINKSSDELIWKFVAPVNFLSVIYDLVWFHRNIFATSIENENHTVSLHWNIFLTCMISRKLYMILVWLKSIHRKHIWPSIITKNHIWPSNKLKKVVWSVTRVLHLLLMQFYVQTFSTY